MSSMHTWTWIAFGVLIVAPFATGLIGWHFGRLERDTTGKHARRDDDRPLSLPPYEGPEIRAKTGPFPDLNAMIERDNNRTDVVIPEWGDRPLSRHELAEYRKRQAPPTGFVALPGPDLGHVTAADIRPVTVPRPPEPAPDPEPRTEGMPALTTTGEMRAATDEFIAKLRSGETAWRAKGEGL